MPAISALKHIIGTNKSTGVNWKNYWATLISATVENAVPTHVVLTFPSEGTSVATDLTCTVNGVARAVNSASWTGAVWTVVLASAVVHGDVVVVTFVPSGGTANVTNNVLGLPADGLVAEFPLYGAADTQQFTDLSGNNVVLYNGADITVESGNDCIVTSSGVFQLGTAGGVLTIPDTAALRFTNGFTITLVYDDREFSVSGNRYNLNKNSNDYALISGYVTSTLEMYSDAATLRTGSQILIPGDYDQHIYTYSYNNTKLIGYRDDNKIVDVNKTGSLNTTNDSLFVLNESNAAAGPVIVASYLIFYNRGLTDAEILQAHAYLRAKINNDCKDSAFTAPGYFTHGIRLLPHIITDDVIVFDGDSLTYGGGGSNYNNIADTIPNIVMGNYSGYDWFNMGIPGKKVSAAIATGAARIDANIRAGKKNICVVWYGTNDMALAVAVDGTTAYNNLVTYCQARQAAGWEVIVLTCINREDLGLPVDFETQRGTFNTLITTNWATFADGLADVAADARIGANNAANSTTYFFSDKVHLNAAGNAIVAALVKTEIDKLI